MISLRKAALATAVSAVLVLTGVIGSSPAAAGPEIPPVVGGGGSSDGGGQTYPGTVTLKCRDGVAYDSDSGKKYSDGQWPGCNGDNDSGYNSVKDKTVDCVVGYLVFRFFGTKNNPSAGYTVSRVNVAHPKADCAKTIRWKTSDSFYTMDVIASPAVLYNTTPMDTAHGTYMGSSVNVGSLNSQGWSDWMKYNPTASKALSEQQYLDSTHADEVTTAVWEVPIPGRKDPLPTTGALIDSVGTRCDDAASQPPLHLDPKFVNGYYGRILDKEGHVSWSTTKLYSDNVNLWSSKYTQDYPSPDLKSRLLVISSGTTMPPNYTPPANPSQVYTPCGSPLDYQIKGTPLVRDATGLITQVKLPNNPVVNGMAYIPIVKTSFVFNYGNGKTGVGMKSEPWTAGNEKLSIMYAKETNSDYTAVAEDAGSKSQVSSSSTLNLLYGSGNPSTRDAPSRAVRTAWRAAITGWIDKNAAGPVNGEPTTTNGVPQVTTVRLDFADGGTVTTKGNGETVAKWAKIYMTDQSATVNEPKLPSPDCAPNCGGTPTPTPTVSPSGPPTPDPSCGSNCNTNPCVGPGCDPPPPPAVDGEFVWRVEATGDPYLQVKSGAASSRLSFTATPTSVWKTPEEAEAWLDQKGEEATHSQFVYWRNHYKNLYDNNVDPNCSSNCGGKYVSVSDFKAKDADFTGRDWAVTVNYEGLGINSWFPQCNTGDPAAACPSKVTRWDQEPQLNPACATLSCYTPDDLSRKTVLPATGSRTSFTYGVGESWPLGTWVYNFYAATSTGKAVLMTRDQSTQLDLNVTYNNQDPAKGTWSVGYSYVPWEWVEPIMDPQPDRPYDCLKTEITGWHWEVGAYLDDNHNPAYGPHKVTDSITVPSTCYDPQPPAQRPGTGVWRHGTPVGASKSGSYLSYSIPDDKSRVLLVNGRPLNGEEGGAGCQSAGPGTAWNYCSPVLAGKVN